MGYKTIFLENFDCVNRPEIESNVNRHLKMMNQLTSMKIAWDNLLSVHISMSYAQRLS